MSSNNIKVCIKVRPLIHREKRDGKEIVWQVNGNTIASIDEQYKKTFDHIYDESKSNLELFEECARPIITQAMKGFNGTIFAYGQTSSGKTYTMVGEGKDHGIVPLTVNEIFNQISSIVDRVFLVRVGYIEIYNEKIFDLLKPDKPECTKIREGDNGRVIVKQQELVTNSTEEMMRYYEKGNQTKKTGETNMNAQSSRSHTIFQIIIESRAENESEEGEVQVSTINLVDLAGSENVKETGATGDRLQEGKNINKSLFALSKVIRDLSDPVKAKEFINKRDSKLTRILAPSLGGNALTTIICAVTPVALEETNSTLNFAYNAKKIKNNPVKNVAMTDEALMRKMQRTIEELRQKLECEMVKNNDLERTRIQDAISSRERQFLHSNLHAVKTKSEISRRRTWCPSSINDSAAMPPPPPPSLKFTPFGLVNNVCDVNIRIHSPIDEMDDEEFRPSDEINLDRTLSPSGRNTEDLARLVRTPKGFNGQKNASDSFDVSEYESVDQLRNRITFLENELGELNDFVKIETLSDEDHRKLELKLQQANELNDDLMEKIKVLENDIEKMQNIIEENSKDLKTKQALEERDKALKQKAVAESTLAGIEMEYDLFKEKMKKREKDLIAALDESRSENATGQQPSQTSSVDIENLKLKIESLEQQLVEANETRQQMATIHKQQLEKISNEYNETSNQLMDQIQEGEDLQKKILILETKSTKIDEIVNKFSDDCDFDSLEYNNENCVIKNLINIMKTCSQTSKDFEESKQKNSELMSTVEDLNYKMEQLAMAVEEKSDEVKQLENSMTNQETEMTLEITELKKGLTELMSLGEENSRLKEFEKDYKKKLSMLIEKDHQITKMTTQYSNLKKNFDDLALALVMKDQEITQLLTDLTKSQNSYQLSHDDLVDSLKTKVEHLQSSLDAEVSENSHLLESSQLLFSECNRKIEELESKHRQEVAKQIDELVSKYSISQDIITSLETKFEECEGSLLITSNELVSVKTNIDNLLNDHSTKDEQIASLSLELSTKNEAIDRLTSEILSKELEIENIRSMQVNDLVPNSSTELQFLENNLTNLKNQQQEKYSEIVELQSTIDSKIIEIDSLHQQIHDANGVITSLKVATEEYEEIVQTSAHELKCLQERFDELQNSSNAKESQIIDLSRLIHEKELEIERLEEAQDRAPANNEAFELKIAAVSLERDQVTVQLKNAQSEIESLQSQCTSLQNSLNCLENVQLANEELIHKIIEFEKISQISTEEMKNLEDKFEELQCQFNLKESQVISLNELLEEKEQEIVNLTANLQHSQEVKQCSDDQESVSKLEEFTKEQNKLITQLTLAQNEIESLKSQCSNLQDELKSLENVQHVNNELNLKIQNYEELLNETQEFKETYSKLKASFDLQKSQVEDLEALLNEKEQEVENLQKVHEPRLDENNEETKSMLVKLESELATLTSQLKDAHSEVSSLKSQCDNLRGELKSSENVQQENVTLKLQIEEFKSENERLNQQQHEVISAKLLLDNEIKELNQHQLILGAENTNLLSKVLLLEAEVVQLKDSLKKRNEEIKEVKDTQKRRSTENDRTVQNLLREKEGLMHSIGAAEARRNLAENNLNDLKTAHEKLQLSSSDVEQENNKLKEKANETDYKLTVLEEKLEVSESKMKTVQDELAQVKEEHKNLQMNYEELKLKKLSPSKRRDSDLFAPHLIKEKTPSTPRSVELNKDRRKSRQSMMDGNRRLSSWELYTDMGTQTDAVSDICACSELQKRIKELQIENLRKQCRVTALEDRDKNHPLKSDLDTAKRAMEREQRCHQQTKTSLDVMSKDMIKLQAKFETFQKKQLDRNGTSSAACQTHAIEHEVNKHDYDELFTKFHELKIAYRQTKDRLQQYEKNMGKENLPSNIQRSAPTELDAEIQKLMKRIIELEEINSRIQTDDMKNEAVSKLKEENETVQKKYEMAKRLCTLRNDDNMKLKLELDNLKIKFRETEAALEHKIAVFQQKYATAKEICEIRRIKIAELEGVCHLKNN